MGVSDVPHRAQYCSPREVCDADCVATGCVEHRNPTFRRSLDVDVRVRAAARAGDQLEPFCGLDNIRRDALVANNHDVDALGQLH